MNEAFLSIGSNIGDRLYYLEEAVRMLDARSGTSVSAVSSIYETTPVGFTEQADFLNLVCRVETELGAQALLLACQEIEQELGRVREVRWGPRTVDLDILLYNNENIEMENLTIPHPRMQERAFVLIPLLEIEPSVSHPVSEKLFSEEAAVQDSGVSKWKEVGVDQILTGR